MREVRIRDTLSGEAAAPRAAGPAERRHLRLRPDRLLADPRRQRAPVRDPHAAAPLARTLGTSRGWYQRHRHQRQDLRRGRARRACRRRVRGRMTRAYIEDTDRLGLGRPDDEPLASETIAEIIALIEALIARRHAYESGGDVYFRVRSFPGYGKLSNRDPDGDGPGRGGGDRQPEGGPARLRALEGAQARRGHRRGRRRGARAGPAGTSSARRWARSSSAPTSTSTAAARPGLPPPRERDRPDGGRARRAARAALDAQRDDPDGRREDVEVRRQHLPALRGARPLRARRGGRLPDLRALPPAARVLRARRWSEAEARVQRIRNFVLDCRRGRGGEPEPLSPAREAIPRRARRRLQHAARARGPVRAGRRGQPARASGARAALEEMLPLLGLESLLAPAEAADAEAERLLAEREQARAERDFERADRLRDELAERGFEVRDTPEGPRLVRRSRRRAVTGQRARAEVVYGRRPVAEARAGSAPGASRLDDRRSAARELTAPRRLARPPGHRRRGRSLSVRRPGALLARPDALVVALDQVQDPRNLGAVCRSAEAAGAAGRGDPAAPVGAVTAAACKASAGAVEHLPVARVPNLADWLGDGQGGRGLGVRGRGRRRDAVRRARTSTGEGRARARQRGGGLRRRVAESCDLLVSIPSAGRSSR